VATTTYQPCAELGEGLLPTLLDSQIRMIGTFCVNSLFVSFCASLNEYYYFLFRFLYRSLTVPGLLNLTWLPMSKKKHTQMDDYFLRSTDSSTPIASENINASRQLIEEHDSDQDTISVTSTLPTQDMV